MKVGGWHLRDMRDGGVVLMSIRDGSSLELREILLLLLLSFFFVSCDSVLLLLLFFVFVVCDLILVLVILGILKVFFVFCGEVVDFIFFSCLCVSWGILP